MVSGRMAIGAWAGDLFLYIFEHFNPTPDISSICSDDNKESLAKLRKICEGKVHLVVNLDKKEYLDPRAYSQDTNALEFGFCRKSVLTCLVIKLIFSTVNRGGDLPEDAISLGIWAGDRITICTAEQLEDFETFKDASNVEDVKKCFIYKPSTPIDFLN